MFKEFKAWWGTLTKIEKRIVGAGLAVALFFSLAAFSSKAEAKLLLYVPHVEGVAPDGTVFEADSNNHVFDSKESCNIAVSELRDKWEVEFESRGFTNVNFWCHEVPTDV